MKYTYDVPETSKGWTAKSFLESEKLKDTILGLASSNPSTYIGITSDGRLEFKGCAIRIEAYFSGPFCSKVSVEFHDDFKRIKQGFIDFWMLLYDQRIVMSQPSTRIQIPDTKPTKKQDKSQFITGVKKYQRTIEGVRNILMETNEMLDETSASFLAKRIVELAHLVGDYDHVLEVFEREAKRQKLKYENVGELVVNNFVSKATLDRWKKKRKDERKKK